MKQMNLKSKKHYKKVKIILIIIIFIISTIYTFSYLNKNIYNYNTKEYLNLFTKISFNFENSMNNIIDKLFDIYDGLTNTEVVKR